MRFSLSLVLMLSLGLSLPCLAVETPIQNIPGPSAQIWTYGEVSLNNDPIISGTTVFSGSLITTGAGSTAVVALANSVRFEVLPYSSLFLEYEQGSVLIKLTSGIVRVVSPSGIGTSVSTNDGVISADPTGNAMFSVEVSNGTDLTAFSGKVSVPDGSGIREKRPSTFFRNALPQLSSAAGSTSGGSTLSSSSLAATLIGIGAVVFAVTGLVTPRDEALYFPGGVSRLR